MLRSSQAVISPLLLTITRMQGAQVIFPFMRNCITEFALINGKLWKVSRLSSRDYIQTPLRSVLAFVPFYLLLFFSCSIKKLAIALRITLKLDYYVYFVHTFWHQRRLIRSQSIANNVKIAHSFCVSLRLQIHLSLSLPTIHPAGLQRRWKLVDRTGRFIVWLHWEGHKRGEKQSLSPIFTHLYGKLPSFYYVITFKND